MIAYGSEVADEISGIRIHKSGIGRYTVVNNAVFLKIPFPLYDAAAADDGAVHKLCVLVKAGRVPRKVHHRIRMYGNGFNGCGLTDVIARYRKGNDISTRILIKKYRLITGLT